MLLQKSNFRQYSITAAQMPNIVKDHYKHIFAFKLIRSLDKLNTLIIKMYKALESENRKLG